MDLPANVPPVIRDAARAVRSHLDEYAASGRDKASDAVESTREPAGNRTRDASQNSSQDSSHQAGHDFDRERLVLVACSGGPDSTALALAAAHAQRSGLIPGWQVGAVIVDHGLQDDSASVAARTAGRLSELGLAPVDVVRVQVDERSGEGPEAAARQARYAALEQVSDARGADVAPPRQSSNQTPNQTPGGVSERAPDEVPVLLGHTLDDQAETVLLGLARGSGARSLAGMAPARGRYLRPLLTFRRDDLRQALDECDVAYFDDPHNEQRRFLRARVRHDLMPTLTGVLGDQAVVSLARTAELLRADADALDASASQLLSTATVPLESLDLAESSTDDESGTTRPVPDVLAAYDVKVMADAPAAVLGRAVRQACVAVGVPAGSLTADHVRAVCARITDWRGQGAVQLPALFQAARRSGTLMLERSAHQPEPTPER